MPFPQTRTVISAPDWLRCLHKRTNPTNKDRVFAWPDTKKPLDTQSTNTFIRGIVTRLGYHLTRLRNGWSFRAGAKTDAVEICNRTERECCELGDWALPKTSSHHYSRSSKSQICKMITEQIEKATFEMTESDYGQFDDNGLKSGDDKNDLTS